MARMGWRCVLAVITAFAGTGCNTILGVHRFEPLDDAREGSDDAGDADDANDADDAALDAPAGCCGESDTCNAHGTESPCTASGCDWATTPVCTGTPQSCASQGSSTTCGQHAGCLWDPAGPCGGTDSCATYDGNAIDCQGHGCTLTACGGTHDACATFTTNGQSTCNLHSCVWQFGTCTGILPHRVCSTYTDSAMCARHGCTFTSGTCQGTPHPCSSDRSSETLCESEGGCETWSPPVCTGTPHACTSTECSNQAFGCRANVCGGTAAPCSTYTLSADCIATGGCTWDAAGPCGGTPASCTTHADSVACGANGCTWTSNGACVPPTDCDGRVETSCVGGCAWQPTCGP